jgi:two-component system, NtrC family, nitrogen regulation response regulator NtrX
LGGAKKVKVDVRIITSTSRDLPSLIALQKFREDFYHRLGVIPIKVPALGDRREDIPDLVDFFAKSYALASGQPLRQFSVDAVAVLQTRDWPGNVRELRNNVERVMILATGEQADEILASHVAAETPAVNAGAMHDGLLSLPLREARDMFERDYIAAQLSRFSGNISRTANFIGMERSALHRKIKTIGLTAKESDEVTE